MKVIELLIVEDQESIVKNHIKTIEVFENENSVKINVHHAKNLEEAKNKLSQNNYYDAAIVDLVLETGSLEIAEGNDVLKEIVNKLPFPVFVYSGNPNMLDSDFKQSFFFKIYTRDHELHVLLNEIIKINKTGITNILGGRGKIEAHLGLIFWNQLIHTMDYWLESSTTNENIEKTLLRYTVFHLVETLYRTDAGGFEKHDASEFYIYPSLDTNLFTGDIIKAENDLYIVLTPSCDMVIRSNLDGHNPTDIVKRNVNRFTTARLKVWNKFKDDKIDFTDLNSNSSKKLIESFKRYSKNTVNRYHFLPPYLILDGYFVDFQDLNSFSFDNNPLQYNIIASVASSFMKDITARFSYYYSRQGQPDLNIDAITDSLLANNSAN